MNMGSWLKRGFFWGALWGWIFFLFSLPLQAQVSQSFDYHRVSIHFNLSALSKETTQVFCLIKMNLDPGWHTYAKNPGQGGYPIRLKWTLPEGVTAGDIQFLPPISFKSGEMTSFGYENFALFGIPLFISNSFSSQNPNAFEGQVQASWLLCKETLCLPQETSFHFKIPVEHKEVLKSDPDFSKFSFSSPQKNLPKTVYSVLMGSWLLAFLGGLILNVMPCVLPILSLKAIHLVSSNEKKSFLYYITGVLFSFLILFMMITVLKKTGQELGWGFQLQSPFVVLTLVYTMMMVGLSLSGLFVVPNWLYALPFKFGSLQKGGSHFLSGCLAVILATPCTAPFMAPAIGFAFLQSPLIGFSVIMSMALGFLFPFLLLLVYPKSHLLIPKPGPWMTTLKEFLAFPLYLSSIWLIWVLANQVGTVSIISCGIGICMLLAYCWAYPKLSHSFFKALLIFMTVLVFIFSFHLIKPSSDPVIKNRVSDIQSLLALKKPVFVNVTASWCLTCQVNDLNVLKNDAVVSFFKKNHIDVVTLDWTKNDPDITAFLSTFNRKGVPLYLYYPPGKSKPIILPQLLTIRTILSLALSDGVN